jgi:hypothetical protein
MLAVGFTSKVRSEQSVRHQCLTLALMVAWDRPWSRPAPRGTAPAALQLASRWQPVEHYRGCAQPSDQKCLRDGIAQWQVQ